MRFGIVKLENSVFVCLCSHLSLYLDNIAIRLGIVKSETGFSFASALAFHYICSI